MSIKWKETIRDACILSVLTGLGGFVIGFSGAAGDRYILAIAASNLIFSIVGFTISGCMAKNKRFKHLFNVAVAVWVISLINILFGLATVTNWLFSFIFILLSMALGGWLSFVFVKPDTNETSNKTN